jgi:adiponectin receptor
MFIRAIGDGLKNCISSIALTYRRPTSASAHTCFASLFHLHNQTINTYSHLLGSVVFAFLPYYFFHHFYKRNSNAQIGDLFVVTIYSYGTAACFILSAT